MDEWSNGGGAGGGGGGGAEMCEPDSVLCILLLLVPLIVSIPIAVPVVEQTFT